MGPSSEPAAPRERQRQFAVAAAATLGLAAAAVLGCAAAPRGAGGEARQSLLRSQLAAAAGARRLYSTSTSYCYEQDSLGDCWAGKPASSAPTCIPSWTPSSAAAACRCPEGAGVQCLLDELSGDPPTTGRCSEVKVYVPGGQMNTQPGTGNIDVTGSDAPEVYCESMVLNDEWGQRGLVASSSDGPAEKDSCWWDWDYTWRDGKCQRRERFLGETCWDSWLSYSGVCSGSDTSYGEYSTSCYQGKCVPYAEVGTREQCECAWIGWNFIVACSSQGGVCGGHACVLSTGDGSKYCDYATGQDW